MNADLHCHTKISDGSTGIDELIFLAKKKGISTISVTDHDTFAGSVRAKIFGKKHGIEVISGAEFSAFDYKRKRNVHILCYMCDYIDRLEGLCKKINEARKQATAVMLQKVIRMYPIFPEMIIRRAQGSINIFIPHIMHALIDAGYTKDFFGSIYKKLFTFKTGFAYVQPEFPDVREVINRIHESGGLAVLAHAKLFDSCDLLKELLEEDLLDGIEVWHPLNSKDDEEFLINTAKEYNLIMTGGTDFHGMYAKEPHPVGTCTTPKEQIKLMKRIKENRINKVQVKNFKK